MQTTDLKELKDAVERAQRDLHPELDGKFLESVILAEERFPEDDQAALAEIRARLAEALVVDGDA